MQFSFKNTLLSLSQDLTWCSQETCSMAQQSDCACAGTQWRTSRAAYRQWQRPSTGPVHSPKSCHSLCFAGEASSLFLKKSRFIIWLNEVWILSYPREFHIALDLSSLAAWGYHFWSRVPSPPNSHYRHWTKYQWTFSIMYFKCNNLNRNKNLFN